MIRTVSVGIQIKSPERLVIFIRLKKKKSATSQVYSRCWRATWFVRTEIKKYQQKKIVSIKTTQDFFFFPKQTYLLIWYLLFFFFLHAIQMRLLPGFVKRETEGRLDEEDSIYKGAGFRNPTGLNWSVVYCTWLTMSFLFGLVEMPGYSLTSGSLHARLVFISLLTSRSYPC